MSSTFTPNINAELQGVGDNPGTWGNVLNNAALAVIDSVFGGSQSISLSNVPVAINTTQSQNNIIRLTGTLTGNVVVTFPAIGRTYYIKNSTTGSFSVTIARSGGGTTVVIPQGQGTFVVLDSAGVSDLSVLAVTSGTASGITISDSIIILKQATDPAPTAEGDMRWSTLLNTLNIGDGAATKRFWAGVAPGALFGCTLSNNITDPTNDIDFAAGIAADSTNLFYMTASALTKRLDAAWVVGTNQGGLFSGAIANTTYHCFIIMNPTTGVVDAGFDTSPVAANRPAAYTLYRRVGSIRRDAAAIRLFKQADNNFTWVVPANDSFGFGTSSRTIGTLTVPTGVAFEARINVAITFGNVSGGSKYSLLTSLDQTDTAASSSCFTAGGFMDSAVDGGSSGGYAQIRTNTSGQIGGRRNVADFDTGVITYGYVDNRGIWS